MSLTAKMKCIAVFFLACAIGCFWLAHTLPGGILGWLVGIALSLSGVALLSLAWLTAANGIRGG